MQLEITDQAAIVFAQRFYGALVRDGEPVDAAIAKARMSLFASDADSLEWGTPVLFMRVADGRIFDFAVDRSPSQPSSTAERGGPSEVSAVPPSTVPAPVAETRQSPVAGSESQPPGSVAQPNADVSSRPACAIASGAASGMLK
jgi:hypothetical protein